MVVFPKIYDQYERLLRSGEPLIAEGTVSLREDEEPKILCNKLFSLRDFQPSEKETTLFIKFTSKEDKRIPAVLSLCREYPGNSPVKLYFADEKKYCYPPGKERVMLAGMLFDGLNGLLGQDGYAVK